MKGAKEVIYCLESGAPVMPAVEQQLKALHAARILWQAGWNETTTAEDAMLRFQGKQGLNECRYDKPLAKMQFQIGV